MSKLSPVSLFNKLLSNQAKATVSTQVQAVMTTLPFHEDGDQHKAGRPTSVTRPTPYTYSGHSAKSTEEYRRLIWWRDSRTADGVLENGAFSRSTLPPHTIDYTFSYLKKLTKHVHDTVIAKEIIKELKKAATFL